MKLVCYNNGIREIDILIILKNNCSVQLQFDHRKYDKTWKCSTGRAELVGIMFENVFIYFYFFDVHAKNCVLLLLRSWQSWRNMPLRLMLILSGKQSVPLAAVPSKWRYEQYFGKLLLEDFMTFFVTECTVSLMTWLLCSKGTLNRSLTVAWFDEE